MRLRGLAAVVGLVCVAGCKFSQGLTHDSGGSGGPDSGKPPIDADMPPPDAGMCQQLGATCANADTLRSCTTMGQPPTDTMCAWGCVAGGTAHCGVFVPSGGVTSGDLMTSTTGLADITLDQHTVNTNDNDGGIGGIRSSGLGLKNGIVLIQHNGVSVFVAKSWTINAGGLFFTGNANAAAFVALGGDIIVNGLIDARSCTTGGASQNPGPGGFKGGNKNANGAGSGAGAGDNVNDTGGGGGGHGGNGGAGNGPENGGAAFDTQFAMLVGGGGGGGGGANGGAGGGGGGAIQLVAPNGMISVNANTGINASGCGGLRGGGGGHDGGGGGGAGGAILLEARSVSIAGVLAANGGGGGGNSQDGNAGGLGSTAATAPSESGVGGAGSTVNGASTTTKFGAGGGGVGYIRIETKSGNPSVSGTISPALGSGPATWTTATVQ